MMESRAKALRQTYLKLQQQHINLDHHSRDTPGVNCIEQQLVDRLEQIKDRGRLCGGALCMFDSGKKFESALHFAL